MARRLLLHICSCGMRHALGKADLFIAQADEEHGAPEPCAMCYRCKTVMSVTLPEGWRRSSIPVLRKWLLRQSILVLSQWLQRGIPTNRRETSCP